MKSESERAGERERESGAIIMWQILKYPFQTDIIAHNTLASNPTSIKRKMIDTFDGTSMTCESNQIDMPLKNSTARGIFAWDLWQLCFLNPDLTRFRSLWALECVPENSLNSLHLSALLQQSDWAPSSPRCQFAFVWMDFWLSDHHHRQCDYANAALYMSKNRQRPIEII